MLTAWDAFPMLDRLIADVTSGVGGTALGTAATRGYSPAIDVRATENEIVFMCDVPGLKHEDLEVTVEAGVLSIKGQRRYQGSAKEKVGGATGNEDLQAEGQVDKSTADAKQAGEKIKDVFK